MTNKQTNEVKIKDIVNDIPIEKGDAAIEMIQAKKAIKLLDDDRKKFNKLNKCLSKGCKGKFIDFDPERYMQQGKKNYRLECEECGLMHRLSVFYPEQPGLVEGQMTIRTLEFSFEVGHPAKLKDKDLSTWLITEKDKVLQNSSPYQRRDEQIMIRVMAMLDEKVDNVIKELNKVVAAQKVLTKKIEEQEKVKGS